MSKCDCDPRARQWNGYGRCLRCGRQYVDGRTRPPLYCKEPQACLEYEGCDCKRNGRPGNDAPPEVQIEIRAAEIAAMHDSDPDLRGCSMAEWHGWDEYVTGADPYNMHDRWWSGYLARCIVDHDEREEGR